MKQYQLTAHSAVLLLLQMMALGHLICYASYLFAGVTAHKVRGHYSLAAYDGDVTQCGDRSVDISQYTINTSLPSKHT